MEALCLELLKELADFLVFWSEVSLTKDFAEADGVVSTLLPAFEEIFHVQDADDVILVLFKDRYPRVSALACNTNAVGDESRYVTTGRPALP